MRTGSMAAMLVLPLAAACSSESRLWRFSPMHEDEPQEADARADRLNLWPLAYADPRGGAVLWPLIDFDRHGFAVRPLVSVDDAELDVLFPLSHFDLDSGDGWALTGYSFGDSVGFFPLFHSGPTFGYAGPAWWSLDQGELTGGGLFPVAGFGEFNYVGPAWWTKPSDAEASSFGLFPLWWSLHDDAGSDQCLLPLYYWRERGPEGLLITPLGGRGWDADGDTRFVNVLGPLFHHSEGRDDANGRPERETTAFLWPLVQHERVGEENSFRVWPLWGQSDAAEPLSPLYEWTLAAHHSHGSRWSNHFFPLYAGEGDGTTTEQSALLSLLRHERTPTGSSWRAWPLVSTDTTDEPKSFGEAVIDFFTLVGVDRKRDASHLHLGTRLLFDVNRYGEEQRSWNAWMLGLVSFGHDDRPRARSPLVERTHAGFLFDWFLVDHRVDRTPEGVERDETHCRLPLLHEYRRTRDDQGERKEWDLLCWTVHSVEEADEDKVTVLGGYAYRWERKGDRTSRDIFPFVTYDTAPDSSRFSFLWRLFEYRREGDRRGGHVLFIPWGHRS